MSKFINLKPCKRILREKYYLPDGADLKAIKKSLPFIESIRGEYVHRVKHVSLYTSPKGNSHFIVKTWCGASFCVGGGGKGQCIIIEKPSSFKPVCACCEGKFVGSGQSGSRVINGNLVMYRPHGYGDYE